MRYSIEQIAKVVGGQILRGQGEFISNVITDSRLIFHPSESLFIALKGPNHDGHRYIKELYEKGVRSFLVDESYLPTEDLAGAGFISVVDTLAAFQELASFHRKSFTGEVVAITGSNGKTVVKEWLSQLLSQVATVAKNPKSYNSQVGVPLSVMMMDRGPDYHILEAGISRPGEMQNLENVIRPDTGIITNIGDAHQENFDSPGSKLSEKLKLFKDSGTIIFCKDDKTVRDGIEFLYSGKGKALLSWSFISEAELRIVKKLQGNGQTTLTGIWKGENYILTVPFTDYASLQNLIHIWLFWLHKGYSNIILQDKVMGLEPVAMRLEQKEGINGCTLINDYYNADLHSLSIAIDLLMNQLPQKKKSLILSELLQTGLDERELIERINNLLENKGLYRIIGIGPLFVNRQSSFNFPLEAFEDTSMFLDRFSFSKVSDEAILLKGARKYTFEKISRRLEKRVHNTFVEVKMNNLLHNLNYFRSKISPGTKVMAMVKASSYGSGTHEIGKFLAHHRIDYLGVAFADEGVNLREAGIDTPIMVMNAGPESFDALLDNRLEPEIYSLQILKGFLRAASLAGTHKYPVHLKIDTGMHRLGLQAGEVDEVIGLLGSQDILQIKSVFSHLSSSDIPKEDGFTHEQAETFKNVCERIRLGIGGDFLCHLVNTAGILRFTEYHFDMVRLGIGLYGIYPGAMEPLLPVISLKSNITQIHELRKGESVGYGNSEKIKYEGRVAVIPVGYADGLDRRLGNGNFSMLINNQSVPTIGRICMDMCMLDISSIQAEAGDEVTIIGPGNDIEKMSAKLATIPYEILTRIPSRVKRIYLFE